MEKEKINVKYKNQFNVPLTGFSAAEMDIFMSIITFVRDRGTETIVLSYDQFRQAAGLGKVSNNRVYTLLENLAPKILAVVSHIEDSDGNTHMVLFPTFQNNSSSKTLRIAVNKDYTYLLNHFNEGGWTGFELLTFTGLKSRYSKALFRYLKQWKSIGKYSVSLDDFIVNLDIPEKYDTKKINQKILQPCIEELRPHFKGLKVEKKYKSTGRQGRPILSEYVFRFKAQKSEELNKSKKYERAITNSGGVKSKLICPYCQRHLMEKRIHGNIAWCHPDYLTGPCNVIFNDVAEIHTAKRQIQEKEEQENMTPEMIEAKKKITGMTEMFKSHY